MARWLYLLGGMGVWLAHFLGVYGIASIADVVRQADAPVARWIVGAFTVACAAASSIVGWTAAGRAGRISDGPDRFIYSVGALGAALSVIAVLWQGLPALIGH